MNIRELQRVAEVRRLAAEGEAKRLRTAAGLSLSEVAAACKVDASTVWRWEENRRSPRGSAALRYGRVLNVLAAPQRAS